MLYQKEKKIVYSDCINLVIAVTKLYIKYIVKEVMNYENKKKNSSFVAANNEFELRNVSKQNTIIY